MNHNNLDAESRRRRASRRLGTDQPICCVAWKRTHAAWNSIILQGKLLEATSLLFVATVSVESLVTRKRTTQRS